MAGKKVLYFFSFHSPYAALADIRIDPLLESVGAELEPIPLVPPPSDPPEGLAAMLQENKLEYIREDAERWARHLRIPWATDPGPIEGLDAVAAYYYADERGHGRNFRSAVFRSRWCEGKNIDDHAVLAECAEDCRLSGNDLLQGIRTKLYHARVDQNLVLALENRIFGVPVFVFNGKRFWGNDRLDFLIEEIAAAEA